MGGSGGFAKGGAIGSEAKEGASAVPEPEVRSGFRRGGSVGGSGGGDVKARHKGVVHKGR
jgi:hypothetical protein